MITTIMHNSQFIIMITTIIQSYSNRVLISTHNYDNTDTNSSSPKGSSKRIKICRANQIVPWLILFFNHYPTCLSPPFEGTGEVFPFVRFRHLFGTPLLWRGWGRFWRGVVCKQFSIYYVSTYGLLAS